jgi:hypothetical protein
VEDDFHAAHRPTDQGCIPYITFQDFKPVIRKLLPDGLHIFDFARTEIIQHPDMIPLFQQGLDNMGANKTSAACNKSFQFISLSVEGLYRWFVK